ncbi:MAG: hypothetical protein HXX81_00745 [Campylobacterales bacterium]|nr:hypothetical protein [Campylobacterales bacterium]
MQEKSNLFIVGLGASAGGFEALQKFIQNIEPNDRLCYVTPSPTKHYTQ